MKKTFLFGLLAAVLGFTSCSKDDDAKNVPVEGITLSATTAELTIGGDPAQATTTLTATVAPVNATEKSVVWTSSNSTVATVTAEGIVNAVAEGTATITATAKDGSGKSANCVITVVKAALATTGTAKATINGSEVDVVWLQLWENGPKFAEYNVGATSATEYGGYYCWGMSIDKDPSGTFKTGSDILTGNDDTATNLWGSNWRMPTKAELEALLANCDVEWTENYNNSGIKGKIFTGKGDYKDNNVFLPATGDCYQGNVAEQGVSGNYWSSTPLEGVEVAYNLLFESTSQGVYLNLCGYGYTVRAVLAEE